MEDRNATNQSAMPPLHTVRLAPQTTFNRLFAVVYACAILALLYHHMESLIFSETLPTFCVTLIMLLADLVLTFMWISYQALRMCPVLRQEYPENLKKALKKSNLPGLDVFICTADPYKEPPIGVVNTALSVMGYDYPAEKISVYVSDDGGSALTLFAFMEATKFAAHWLPFCKKNNVMERNPEAYFESNHACSIDIDELKIMYMDMKVKIEHVLERGKIDEQYINSDTERAAFNKWSDTNFSRHDHPSVIQVLLDSSNDRDITGNLMPNLIYVSRQKCKSTPHHFKAGALNVLLRVSAAMTNAPVILSQDCDMYSSDPQTPYRALCYLCDPQIRSKIGYVQFPQRFQGLNKTDIYAGAFERLYVLQTMGYDGLGGPNYLGSCCFFNRRVFFGGPLDMELPEIPQLRPDYVVDKPIRSHSVLSLAHEVASCSYERQTKWGSKIGLRYGSLSEDLLTGYRQKCEGWRAILCNPEIPSFLGDAPSRLIDFMSQQKRWAVGQLEIAFSKYCPLTYGIKNLGVLMGLGYALQQFWPIWSIPIVIYAFLPPLALLNKVHIFPAASQLWFLLYVFLFVGAYGQDLLDFILIGGTTSRWWNDQRIWLIRGLTSYLFGSTEFLLKSLGIATRGFNVTSKAIDDEQSKRYDQGIFEFGVHSSMFVSLAMTALINLAALVHGIFEVFKGNDLDKMLMQLLLSGFAVVNCWPIYEGMMLRSDKGKMPIKTSVIALCFSSGVYMASSCIISRD